MGWCGAIKQGEKLIGTFLTHDKSGSLTRKPVKRREQLGIPLEFHLIKISFLPRFNLLTFLRECSVAIKSAMTGQDRTGEGLGAPREA